LPKSVIYTSINFDMMSGLRGGLAEAGINDIEIKTENIGIGGNDKQIYTVCEQMLMAGINIVAGYVNPATAEKLAPLFVNGNGLFISLDAGYHYPSSLSKPSHVFYISLQGALCCRITTRMALAAGAKKMAYTSSYYEAGYRSAYAFYKGLEDEQGEITMNHITKLNRREFSLAPLEEHVKNGGTDAIFASFCGDMLQDFCVASAKDNIFAESVVYGAPFMGEEQWLEQCPYPGVDIKVCVPWGRELDNEENKKMTKVLNEKKQKANVFSVLGWEAGVVIAAALGAGDTDAAIALLEGYSFNSPRGEVRLDADTHQCHAPVYEAVVQKNEQTEDCRLTIGNESPYTAAQRQRHEHDISSIQGAFTSWVNAYACLES